MNRIFKYFLCLMLAAGLHLHTGGDAHAQWIVADPTQTATNLASFLEQIGNGINQLTELEQSSEWLNNMRDAMDRIQGSEAWKMINEFVYDIGMYKDLALSLEQCVNLLNVMKNSISSMAEYGYSTSMLNTLMSYMLYTVNHLNYLKDKIENIIKSKNFTFGEKIENIDRIIEDSNRALSSTVAKVNVEVKALEEMRSVLAFTNWLDDNPAAYGLDGVGNTSVTVDELEDVDEDNVDYEDFMDTAEVSGFSSNIYKIVILIIGILAAISLCVALARYVQGVPGAEIMFVRILVAAFGSFVVLSILGSVFNL